MVKLLVVCIHIYMCVYTYICIHTHRKKHLYMCTCVFVMERLFLIIVGFGQITARKGVGVRASTVDHKHVKLSRTQQRRDWDLLLHSDYTLFHPTLTAELLNWRN